MQQQLEMDRSSVCFAVEYHFAHALVSLSQVQELDALRSRHLKACLKLPATSASDVLYLDKRKMGCGLSNLA